MKPTTPPNVCSTTLALVCGAALACAAGFLSARGIILDEAIDDYSGDPGITVSETRPGPASGYRTTFILEEAYHDYDGRAAGAFNTDLQEGPEQAEMAAFEVTHPPTAIPWELGVTD
jgi:hypothetical protein